MKRDAKKQPEFRICPRPLPESDLLGAGRCFAPREGGVEVDTLILHACYLAPEIQAVSANDNTIAGIARGDESVARELAAAWREGMQSSGNPVRSAEIEVRALAALIMARRGREGFSPFNLDSICDLFEFYGVSAHYVIDREGIVFQLVSPDRVAFHAGESRMPSAEDGRTGVNNFSIGIEFLATPESGYTDAQYIAAGRLIRSLMASHPLRYFYGHSDIAPGRKSDPVGLDWNRIAQLAGLDRLHHHFPPTDL